MHLCGGIFIFYFSYYVPYTFTFKQHNDSIVKLIIHLFQRVDYWRGIRDFLALINNQITGMHVVHVKEEQKDF